MILAVIFVIACFNTCVGLFSCCGQYFFGVFPGIGYRRWVLLFAAVSMGISNGGLDAILRFSEPVLNAIYPVAIMLIFLAFAHPWLGRFQKVYPCSVALCGLVSVLTVLGEQGLLPAFLQSVLFRNAGSGGRICLALSFGGRDRPGNDRYDGEKQKAKNESIMEGCGMFQDRVAVITGGAHGIGKCIAEEFKKNRASVCILDRTGNEYFSGDVGIRRRWSGLPKR